MHLRPLGIGELLDASIRVCVAQRWTLLKIVLVVVVPAQVLSAIVLASTFPDDFLDSDLLDPTAPAPTIDGQDAGTFAAGVGVIIVLSGVMFLLGTGACFRAITEAWLGREPDWRESLGFAVRRSPSLMWTSIAYVIAMVIAFLLLVIPAIWGSIAFVLCIPVALVERTGGFRSLRRSAGLVRGRWWPTLGVLLVGFFLAGIVSTIVQYALSLPVFVVTTSPLAIIIFSTIGAIAGYMVATPFQAALVALVYFDLRVRKEGLDLELVAERMGAQPPERGPEPAPAPVPAGGARPDEGPDGMAGVPGSFDPAPPRQEPEAPKGWLPPTAS